MFSSETIKRRVSCRTYENIPIREDDRQKLKDFTLTNVRGPFGNRLRFELIDVAVETRGRWF